MSQRFLLLALVMLWASFAPGCASDTERDSENDRLWRAGYGFNNPNPERLRKGEPPVNFDGSVYK